MNIPTQNHYILFYAYFEKDESYKQNLMYFLSHGILENVDHIIILCGKCTVDIPKKDNLYLWHRQNVGFDFGAWSECIRYLTQPYDYYIFMNSSVRGPFYQNKNSAQHKSWLDTYLLLFNTEDVKLVGSSINIYFNNRLKSIYGYDGPYTHVQSMFFILHKDGFFYLRNKGFFEPQDLLNKDEIIIHKEIKMSQLILQNHWNLNCILSKYQNKDYRKIRSNFNPSGMDPYHKHSYFGQSIDPYEVIFFKMNRDVPFIQHNHYVA